MAKQKWPVQRRAGVGFWALLALAVAAGSGLGVLLWQITPPGATPVAPAAAPAAARHQLAGATPEGDTTASGAITGVVRAPGGTALADVDVVLSRFARNLPAALATVRSGADGRFAFERLGPGRYALSAVHGDHGPAVAGPIAVSGNARATADLQLGAGGFVLSGLISDSGGGPIAARLELGVVPPGLDARALLFVARSGADGRYRVRLPAGRLGATVSADGYASARRGFEHTADRVLNVNLDAGATLAGRVLDGSGQPVAGARLLARPTALEKDVPPLSASAVSDAEGRFRLTGLGAGGWWAEARHSGRFGRSARQQLSPSATIEDVDVTLGPAFKISGRVQDGNGRAPAEGEVKLEQPEVPGALTEAKRLGPAGEFEFLGMPGGNYVVHARDTTQAATGRQTVVVDRDVTTVVVTLTPTAAVFGRVLDDKGAPVGGAEVAGRPAGGGTTSVVTSRADGTFELQGLAAGAPLVFSAAKADVGSSPLARLTLAQGARVELQLRLAAGATLRGLVRNPDGSPAVDATVSVLPPTGEGSERPNLRARTDASGAYQLRGVSAGEHPVGAAASGRLIYRPGIKRVVLREGEEKTINFTLLATGRVTGVVTLSDGQPAPGVLVLAGRGSERPEGQVPRATTDGEGTFVLEDLVPGELYVLWAEKVGHGQARSQLVRVGDTKVKIVLHPEAVLAGAVVDAQGRPVTGYDVQAVPTYLADPRYTGPVLGKRFGERVIGADGRFALRGLPAGSYEVRVAADTRGSAQLTVTVQPGEQRSDLRLELAPAGSLRGRLVDPDGTGLAGALVATWGAGQRAQVTTGADGRFEMPAPALNAMDIQFKAEGFVIEREVVGLATEAGKNRGGDIGTIRLVRERRAPKLGAGPPGLTGIEHERHEGQVVIARVRPRTAAAASGLRVGERIVAIDGISVSELGHNQRADLLIGAPNTPVMLTVEGAGGQRTVRLVRRAGEFGGPTPPPTPGAGAAAVATTPPPR